jgi:hypothetical protein
MKNGILMYSRVNGVEKWFVNADWAVKQQELEEKEKIKKEAKNV